MRTLESLVKRAGGWDKIERSVKPKTKDELRAEIKKHIREFGYGCDLNDIDTSLITDMSFLFDELNTFYGDVSGWDVSNVTDMSCMFISCFRFNCDLSHWNVSSATDMSNMFCGCHAFDCDLSRWDVSNVTNFSGTFYKTSFNHDISNWKTKVKKPDCWHMFTPPEFAICKVPKKNMPKFFIDQYGEEFDK